MIKYIYEFNDKIKGAIEHEEGVGFYLYIYDLETSKILHDYLEDSLLNAQEKAQEEFSLDMRLWREA